VEAIMIAQDWRHAFTRIQIEYIEMPDLKLTRCPIGAMKVTRNLHGCNEADSDGA
jgi:hypothetical protein